MNTRAGLAPELPSQARSFAETMARYAVRRLRAGAALPREALHKAPGDFASALDAEIERALRARIARRFPMHGFRGEETGAGTAGDGRFEWLVDPIDGSVNFVRGYPQYSVSIALLHAGEPVAGCIADPCRGELFSAHLGGGATCNGRPIRVAATARLSEALAATVFPKPDAAFMPHYLARLGRVMTQVAGVRRAGSMALEMAYLAAGRVDLFWERGMAPWDAAAGVLLVREAGGRVFTLDGLPWRDSAEVAACTPALQAPWQGLLLTEAS